MMSFIDDDESKLFHRHSVFVTSRHECLYRSHLNNLFQLLRVSTHDDTAIDATFRKFICCLLYQFSDMGKNENVRMFAILDNPIADVANDRSEQNRLACSRRHLYHDIIHGVPLGKDKMLHLFLIGKEDVVCCFYVRISHHSSQPFERAISSTLIA